MSSRRRFSTPAVPTLGKVLTFDWDLFMTDTRAVPLKKSELEYGQDYLILNGNFSGKIARYVGTSSVKQWGSFQSVRGNEVRVRCDGTNFACIPRLGCWMESLASDVRVWDRPAMLVIQAKSLCGVAPQDEVNVAVREGNRLLASWRYRRDITAESIDLPRLEATLCKLGRHRGAHATLQQLVKKGFFACYEDDGWLIKCNAQSRIRFMRRSHLISITVCRCGRDVTNAMFDDATLRALLPSRYFGGLLGKRLLEQAVERSKKPHARRSSSFAGDMNFSVEDWLDADGKDTEARYQRVFARCGSVDGNLLIKDTKFLDGIRSFIANGGVARNCICPNVGEWRRMVRMCAKGEDDFGLMEDVRVVNGQWVDAMNALPNSHARAHSFSCVYYDGTVELNANKIGHKVIKEVHPKQDIALVFEKHILMNGAYLVIALSRKGVDDVQLAGLFENVREFVSNAAEKFAYNVKRVAFGIYRDQMIYCDFQVWIKPKTVEKKRRIRVKYKMEMKASDESKECLPSRAEKRLSNLGLDPSKYEFYNKEYENDVYYDEEGNMLTADEVAALEKKQNNLYQYYRPHSHGNKMSEHFVNNKKFQHFQGSLATADEVDEHDENDDLDDSADEDSVYTNTLSNNNNYASRYSYYSEYNASVSGNVSNISTRGGSSGRRGSRGTAGAGSRPTPGTDATSSSDSEDIQINNIRSGRNSSSTSAATNYNTRGGGGTNGSGAGGKGPGAASGGAAASAWSGSNRYYEYYRPQSHGNKKSEDMVNNPKFNSFFENLDQKEDSSRSSEDEDVRIKGRYGTTRGGASGGKSGRNGGNGRNGGSTANGAHGTRGHKRRDSRDRMHAENGAQGMLARHERNVLDSDESEGEGRERGHASGRSATSQYLKDLLGSYQFPSN